MKKILVTSEFCSEAKKLVNSHQSEAVNSLRTVLILLVNNKSVPKKFRDHKLSGSEFRELHIARDILLLYKNETDSNTLIVTLKLANITNHKGLREDANKKYEYKEVSTQDLHDITSSIVLTAFDEEVLNDVLESISDYASTYLKEGFVLLGGFYVEDNSIRCTFDYYSYEDEVLLGSIDFVIPLDYYRVHELESYVDDFAKQVSNEFEKF